MAARAEVEVVLKMELSDDVGFVGGSCLRGEGCVENVDVGLVVLGVVEGHDLSADLGLECLWMCQFCVLVNSGVRQFVSLHHMRMVEVGV